MFSTTAKRIDEATIQACWRQWRAVTGQGLAVGSHPAKSIIDPEALVLTSLAMRHEEPRLRDLLLWWAEDGARLLSVQRFRSVARHFPDSALRSGVSWFASRALEAKDGRWKSLVTEDDTDEPVRRGKGPETLKLLEPATVMFQLRAGFGVGVKADLLAYLLGASSAPAAMETWASASTIAAAIGYSRSSVDRVANDMVLARFIEASADHPALYSIEPESWARVLRLRDPFMAWDSAGSEDDSLHVPRWRFWAQVFAFLVTVTEWTREGAQRRVAPVVLASRARDLVETNWRFLAGNGLDIPDGRALPGERYLAAFHGLVGQAIRLVEEAL